MGTWLGISHEPPSIIRYTTPGSLSHNCWCASKTMYRVSSRLLQLPSCSRNSGSMRRLQLCTSRDAPLQKHKDTRRKLLTTSASSALEQDTNRGDSEASTSQSEPALSTTVTGHGMQGVLQLSHMPILRRETGQPHELGHQNAV